MPGKLARPVRKEATQKKDPNQGNLAAWPTLREDFGGLRCGVCAVDSERTTGDA